MNSVFSKHILRIAKNYVFAFFFEIMKNGLNYLIAVTPSIVLLLLQNCFVLFCIVMRENSCCLLLTIIKLMLLKLLTLPKGI